MAPIKKKRRRLDDDAEESAYFFKALKLSGIVVDEEDGRRFVFRNADSDASSVIHKLKAEFAIAEDNAKTFSKHLQNFLEDEDKSKIRAVLTPVKRRAFLDASQSSSGGLDVLAPSSIIRILLQVEEIQAELFDYLIERAMLEDDDDEDEESADEDNGENLASSILNQMIRLPLIKDPERLAEKFLEIMANFSRDLLLTLIPA